MPNRQPTYRADFVFSFAHANHRWPLRGTPEDEKISVDLERQCSEDRMCEQVKGRGLIGGSTPNGNLTSRPAYSEPVEQYTQLAAGCFSAQEEYMIEAILERRVGIDVDKKFVVVCVMIGARKTNPTHR